MSATARALRWLHYEQTLNEPIDRDRSGTHRVRLESQTVRARYRPENQRQWLQPVLWLPRGRVRAYGAVHEGLRRAFDCDAPEGCAPLLLHPQMPAAHRRLHEAYGTADLPDVWCTPTSSFRSVLARRGQGTPVVLKLSVGAVIGGARRVLTEMEMANSLIISRLLETIPVAARKQAGFDWFAESAGAVETSSGCGWLLRHLPRMMSEREAGDFIPAFSLISRVGAEVPMLVEMIRRSSLPAEEFVCENIIRPYVRVLAWLLFDQGIQAEAHPQNVLFEIDRGGSLTGRLVLRDLSDMSVSLPMRVANQKPFPIFERDFFPKAAPFPMADIAADHRCNDGRKWMTRGRDTVVKWGLRAFIWSINTSLARFFPRYRAATVERAYLALWQEHAVRCLGVKPPLRSNPRSLAVDWAVASYLANKDWNPVTASASATLPPHAQPLRLCGPMRRRPGKQYQRVEIPWGSLYLDKNLPTYFVPAF